MVDPEVYRSGKGEVNAINERLALLEKDLELLYIRWEELESVKG